MLAMLAGGFVLNSICFTGLLCYFIHLPGELFECNECLMLTCRCTITITIPIGFVKLILYCS